MLAQRLDAALGLVALNKGPSYDLWQVGGPVGRVRVVAPDGTTTVLSSGTVNVSGAAAPASGGTLILAEPYGGWTATLNGQALKPVSTPVDGWAQGFVLPPGGGQISITRSDLARPLSLILELIATLAICLLALPGKRADPIEEAEALAALREARNGKRAEHSTRRATRSAAANALGSATRRLRAGGAGHRAVSGMDRLGFALKRRAGQVPADEASEASASSVPAGQASATAAAQDRERAESAQPEAAQPEAAQPEAVTTAGLGDRGPASHGGLAGEAGTGGSSVAPWDIAGHWDTPSQTGPSGAWSADLPESERPLTDAGRRDASAWMNTRAWMDDSARKDDPVRRTGQQAAAPESPAREGSAREGSGPKALLPESLWPETSAPEASEPEASGPGNPVSEARALVGDGPQPCGCRASAAEASVPEAPVSETRAPWETGPQHVPGAGWFGGGTPSAGSPGSETGRRGRPGRSVRPGRAARRLRCPRPARSRATRGRAARRHASRDRPAACSPDRDPAGLASWRAARLPDGRAAGPADGAAACFAD